jgi:hypothetical protein
VSTVALQAAWTAKRGAPALLRLPAPIDGTDWLAGPSLSAEVKHGDVVIPAGSIVAVQRILPTVNDEGTGEPGARVLLRVTAGPGSPVYWHGLTVRLGDKATLLALGLRFVRPRPSW